MEYTALANNIMNQINSVMIGKEDKVEYVMMTLLAGGHLLIEDVPGIGKTTLATAIASCIDASFGRIQFTPDTMPGDVTGYSIYQSKTESFHFVKGGIMNHIVLADEINRTSPKTQASLLEAMQERQVTIDGKTYELEAPFMVLATQNPIEFAGTFQLLEAQLDRFLMKISLGYPKQEDESRMLENYLNGILNQKCKPVATKEDLIQMQKEVEQVHVGTDIIHYVIDLMNETRKNDRLELGASPRATIALIAASRACAYLAGRDYVIPDDVQKVIQPVIAHRLVLSAEAKMNKVNAKQILQEILRKVTVPVLGGR